jgi:DNA-binding transcriptional regulator PaaX
MDKKFSITDLLLISLEQTIEGYLKIEDFLYNPHLYRYGYPREIKKPSLLKTIKRLKDKGLIDFVSEEKLILKLTEKGKDKALMVKIKTFKDEDWDGKWRLVSFDIPETRRTVRDLLRNRLKEWGFTKMQNSVWKSKVDCGVQMKIFIRELGIEKWVKVLEVSDLS